MIKNIHFLGHSACIIETSSGKIAIDPWLEGNPLTPEEHKNPKDIDLIVLTHGHADHASDTVRLQKLNDCMVAATYELAMILIQEGIPQEKVLAMNKGGSVTFNSCKVVLTNAFHSSSYDSPARGTLYAGEACGVIIKDKDNCIFHAGDTCLFSDLEIIGTTYEPTIALLPIGDRFTMDGKDAAHAARMLGVRKAIPIHYKTFPLLASDAKEFIASCHKVDIEVFELSPGESLKV